VPGNQFRIGAVPDFYCRPVLFGVQQSESPAAAGLFFESAGVNTERLLNDECDAALIGPIEYARNSSDFSLYPSIGVSSRGESRTSVLCVNRNIRSIASVAVGAVSSSDIVLAKIILSEKFEQDIVIVPVIGSVQQMLLKADAALLIGNALLISQWEGPTLDLVDEWTDMTGMPFVHLLCAARKEKYKKEIGSLLLSSQESGAASLPVIAAQQSKELPYPVEAMERQLEGYVYGFDDEAREALGEFFRYAFYLGILPDVPEIEVFGGGEVDHG
jgi:chorismate dehydratase